MFCFGFFMLKILKIHHKTILIFANFANNNFLLAYIAKKYRCEYYIIRIFACLAYFKKYLASIRFVLIFYCHTFVMNY